MGNSSFVMNLKMYCICKGPINTIEIKSRVKGNMKPKDNLVPVLHGTSKDHKIGKDELMGPEVRPIMGSIVGPNLGLSNFLGQEIIRRVTEEVDSDNVCKSTEELLCEFEKHNNKRIENNFHSGKYILGSMDIEKWYTSTTSQTFR